MPAPAHSRLLQMATGIGLLLAIAWAAVTAWLAWQCQWSGPFRDMWEILPLLESTFDGSWHWQDFWVPYGGAHRLVIPQLLFVLDLHLLQGSNRLTLAVSLACQCLILALVIRRARQCYPQETLLPWLAASLALVTLFSGTQLYNLDYSISTQWFEATSLSTLALFLASDGGAKAPLRRTVLILLVGLLASICNSAGILLWPVLAWVMWIRRYPAACLALLAVVAVAMIGTYVHHLDPQPMVKQPGNAAQRVIGLVIYSLVFVSGYLASPLSRHWPWVASLLALALLALLVRDGWRQRHAPTAQDASWRLLTAGMALHFTLVAALAGLGRTMYPGTQTTERYQTGAMLFWLAVALAALAWAQRRGGGWRLLLPLPVLLLALGHDHVNSSRRHIQLANTVRQTHLGISLGVTDMPVSITTVSYPAGRQGHNYVAWHEAFLREHRLGPWGNPLLAWQGKTWTSRHAAHGCPFDMHADEPVNAAGARAIHVISRCVPAGPEYLALVNGEQRVIGLARLSLPEWPGPDAQPQHWDGYITEAASELRAEPLATLP